jgi:hypothetical protein
MCQEEKKKNFLKQLDIMTGKCSPDLHDKIKSKKNPPHVLGDFFELICLIDYKL